MKFTIKTQTNSFRTGVIETDHGFIETPVFMPVGTVGAVKTISSDELEAIGSEIILGNTYHLYLRPGMDIISGAGGLHNFNSWQRPILTDSGGFQVFSLSNLNKITDDGVEFQSHLDGSRHLFTPESCMEIQRIIGADIIMVAFDECPPGKSDKLVVKKAVERTTNWTRRCAKWINNNAEIYDHSQTLFQLFKDLLIKI